MKKIRYGIIGFGNFAERAILPAIRLTDNSEIVAIHKRSIDAAKLKAQEFNIPLYFDSVDALVASSDVDAVFIVSANSAHCSETITAAKAGKNVLVEKPMAMNIHEARQMDDICRENKVKLMVGHMLRFSPLLNRIKEIISSDEIGEITMARAHFFYNSKLSQRQWLNSRKTAGGGPLFDIGIHCLDSIRFILEDDIVSVKHLSHPKPTIENVEQSSLLSLEFKKGTLASIYTSFATSYRESYIEFIGTKGSLNAFNFTPSNVPVTLEIKIGDGFHSFKLRTEDFIIPNLYQLEIQHFSDCLLNNREPIISPHSVLQNQMILDEAIMQ